MKKVFNKLSKIVFVLGILDLIVLVLVLSGWLDNFGENISGIVMTTCLGVIFVCAIFGVLSLVLAIIDGIKKDKIAFLKKVLSNVAWITAAYMVVFLLDYFMEAEFPLELNVGKVILQILISALAIIAGEYMITDHSKEKNEELHF